MPIRERVLGPDHLETAASLNNLAAWGPTTPAPPRAGTAQALALLPGISRSGITMTGELLAGLRHHEAAKFSLLLATTIIAAAGVLEVPQLFPRPAPLDLYASSAVMAGVAAYLSARFLIRWFRSGRLDTDGYCAGDGVLAFIMVR